MQLKICVEHRFIVCGIEITSEGERRVARERKLTLGTRKPRALVPPRNCFSRKQYVAGGLRLLLLCMCPGMIMFTNDTRPFGCERKHSWYHSCRITIQSNLIVMNFVSPNEEEFCGSHSGGFRQLITLFNRHICSWSHTVPPDLLPTYVVLRARTPWCGIEWCSSHCLMSPQVIYVQVFNRTPSAITPMGAILWNKTRRIYSSKDALYW